MKFKIIKKGEIREINATDATPKDAVEGVNMPGQIRVRGTESCPEPDRITFHTTIGGSGMLEIQEWVVYLRRDQLVRVIGQLQEIPQAQA